MSWNSIAIRMFKAFHSKYHLIRVMVLINPMHPAQISKCISRRCSKSTCPSTLRKRIFINHNIQTQISLILRELVLVALQKKKKTDYRALLQTNTFLSRHTGLASCLYEGYNQEASLRVKEHRRSNIHQKIKQLAVRMKNNRKSREIRIRTLKRHGNWGNDFNRWNRFLNMNHLIRRRISRIWAISSIRAYPRRMSSCALEANKTNSCRTGS